MIDAVYDACLRIADAVWARRRLALVVGLSLMLGLVFAINRFVLHDFANSSDEYVYLYQAATMAAGRLWNQTPPAPDALFFMYIDVDAARIYGSFPPGWPLALAMAIAAHVPVWLVNAVLGAATVFLAALLARSLYGPRAAVWVALTLAAMPYVLFNAASYFSHTLCGVLLLGAACLAAGEYRDRWWAAAGVGFLLAWAILARYFTGVVCGIPIGLLLLRQRADVSRHDRIRRMTRTVAWLVAGGVPWMLFLGWYDTMMNGSPWTLTTEAGTYARWFKPGFALRGLDLLGSHVARHLAWTPPALIVLYVLYLRRTAKEKRTPLDWMLVAMVVGLYGYFERGGNQYGTRFHYEAFLFASVFVIGQLIRHESLRNAARWERRAFAAFALSLVAMPIQLAVHAAIEHRVVRERLDPFTTVQRAQLRDAVVFITDRVGTARPMRAYDLTRNGLTYDGPVLYAIGVAAAEDCAVMTHFPTRSPYRYAWDTTRRAGLLMPLDCGGSR
jgi:hypothetical protein